MRRRGRAPGFDPSKLSGTLALPAETDKPIDIPSLVQNVFLRSSTTWNQAIYLYHAQPRLPEKNTVLLILKKSDPDMYFFLQLLIKKDSSLELEEKFSVHLNSQLSIGVDNDFDVSIDSDFKSVNYVFRQKKERDEFVWVLAKLSKGKLNNTIDIEELSASVADIDTRFPELCKLISNHEKGVQENEDEYILATLLDELKWNIESMNSEELNAKLCSLNSTIDMEIIDFLVQWEDLDSVGPKSNKQTGKENGEIMNALTAMDEELDGVDVWLSEQIDRLQEVQRNLRLIEDESGGLESSWQNLTAIRDTLKEVLETMTLTSAEESAVTNYDTFINKTLKSDFANTENVLQPLVSAAKSLQRAANIDLTLKQRDNKESNSVINAKSWKRIESIPSVALRLKDLKSLHNEFVQGCSNSLESLFAQILKHKVLNDENSQKTLAVKSFHLVEWKKKLEAATLTGPLANPSQFIPYNLNAFRMSQHNYQTVLSDYIPFFQVMNEMMSLGPVFDAYVVALRDTLYSNLTKALWKEIRGLVYERRPPITLATVNRYIFGSNYEMTSRFHHQIEDAKYSPWQLLDITLFIVLPAMRQEEIFTKLLFGRQNDKNMSGINEIISNIKKWPSSGEINVVRPRQKYEWESVRSLLVEKLSKYSSATEIDIVEIVASLSSLQMFCMQYLTNISEDNDTQEESLLSLNSLVCVNEVRNELLKLLVTFKESQLSWISQQKVDPKKPGVALPVAKVVGLIHHLNEMLGGQQMECVTQMIVQLIKGTFEWISKTAELNEKYTDIFKISNYYFFDVSLNTLNLPFLQKYTQFAAQQYQQSESRYILWMVTYEFQELADLATRLEGVGARVREEEMALYVRRKDVMTVAKELDVKKLESCASSMKKRLEKHFDSSEDVELHLVSNLWEKIRDKTSDIVKKVVTTSLASYQIALEITPQNVIDIFQALK